MGIYVKFDSAEQIGRLANAADSGTKTPDPRLVTDAIARLRVAEALEVPGWTDVIAPGPK